MKKLARALLVLAAVAAQAAAQKKIDERLPADSDGLVRILNVSGSVEVEGWERGEIHVAGSLASNVERLDFSSEGGLATIDVVMKKGAWSAKDTDLLIRLPVGSSLDIETVSASVDVEGVRGKMRLTTVSGSIRARDGPSAFIAKSTSGSIEIESPGAGGKAQTISGGISLRGPGGDLSAESVSGAILVKGGSLDSATLTTTAGKIRFDADLAKGGRLELSSMSGSIELSLPGDIAASFDLSTFSGRIDSEFGPDAQRGEAPGRKLSFSTGKDARIRAESFSGRVSLQKR